MLARQAGGDRVMRMKRKPGASGSKRGRKARQVTSTSFPRQRQAAAPRRKGKPGKGRGGFLNISPGELAKRLVAQKERARVARQREKAVAVRNKFRQRKSDAGKFVMVGIDGKRNPQDKGRKGYLVYVTKTGKKQLAGYKQDFKPRKISDIEAPAHRNKLAAAKEFARSRLVITQRGRVVVKARGTFHNTKTDDFDFIVNRLGKAIKQTMERQASRRIFRINCNILVSFPDGSTRVYNVAPIVSRADHVAIKLGGIKNFLLKSFYWHFARQLQYDGYVTTGSANHIRRLPENQGKPVSEWRQSDGNKWRGNESEIVQIKQLEWQLEQAR